MHNFFPQVELQIKRSGVIPIKKSLGESIEWLHCDREAANLILKQGNLLTIERMLIDLGEDHFKVRQKRQKWDLK